MTSPDPPWRAVELGPVPVPTMISREEQRYLYWLTSSAWTGKGVVVEMGPWLGGSTLCLASGIADSEHAERFATPLHVFDNFTWRPFMAGPGRPDLAPGESFEEQFRANVRDYQDLLAVHCASLPDDPLPGDPAAHGIRDLDAADGSLLRWTAPEPVEILFIDGAKSWEGLRHLLAELAPHLHPGTALLVCQDYKYWGAYWVPLILELLSDRLEAVHVLERNTVTFRLTAPLSREVIHELGPFEALPVERGVDLLAAAAERLRARGDRLGAAVLRAGTARFLQHREMPARARGALREAEAAWPLKDAGQQLERARAWLEERLDEAIPPSVRTRLRRRLHPLVRRLPLP